jgi:hypothetical protein
MISGDGGADPVGIMLLSVGTSLGNGVGGEIVSIPTSNMPHDANRIETMDTSNMIDALIFMSDALECKVFEFILDEINIPKRCYWGVAFMSQNGNLIH